MLPPRLAVSLPAAELQRVELPAAVFSAQQFAALPVSMRLRQAVRLLEMHCEELVFIARPEMHAHGAARAWLARRLEDIHEHVGISDGTAIKLLPGLRNHVFFHALDLRDGFSALRRLMRRVPETFQGLDTQINSAFSSVNHAMPTSTLLLPTLPQPDQGDMPVLLPLYLDPSSIDTTAHELLRQPTRLPSLDGVARIVYAPLSQTALSTPAGRRRVRKLIRHACMDGGTHLLLRLPCMTGRDDESPMAALVWLLSALHELNLPLPTRSLGNIHLCLNDLPESLLHRYAERMELCIDDAFPLWRYSAALYRRLRQVRCHAVMPDQHWRLPALLRSIDSVKPADHSARPIFVEEL